MKLNRQTRAWLVLGWGLALAWLLTGCASTGRVFAPGGYASEGAGFQRAVESGIPSRQLAAAETAAQRAQRGDAVLYRLEEGRLRLLAGDLDGSIAALQDALAVFELERQQPLLRVTDGFFNAAALATNDRALPYESAGFERLMAHNLLALAHLRKGETDRAAIALNGGVAEMDYLRQRQGAFASAQDRQATRSGVSAAAIETATAGVQERLRADARPGLQPYHNAFTFYLQGILFAQRGDLPRAEIALRRAAELAPGNPAIVAATEQGFRSAPGDALVVLLSFEGLISAKGEIRIPFFWDGTLLQIAMPVYPEAGYGFGGGPALAVNEADFLRPVVVCDVEAQARKELADRYAGIFLRQVLRLVAKYQIQRELEKKDPWAGFAAQIFNLLTDQADTRSWSTLPARLAVAHQSLPPGRHAFAWTEAAGTGAPVAVDLEAGDLLVFLVDQTAGSFRPDWVLIDATGRAGQPLVSLSSEPPNAS